MTDQIKQKKEKLPTDPGHVYIVATPEMEYFHRYKFGFTSKSRDELMIHYRRGLCDHRSIIFEPATRQVEDLVLYALDAYRVENYNAGKSETFALNLDTLINCIKAILKLYEDLSKEPVSRSSRCAWMISSASVPKLSKSKAKPSRQSEVHRPDRGQHPLRQRHPSHRQHPCPRQHPSHQ